MKDDRIRSRASVTVPILKPDGTTQDERVTFRLFHPQLSSYITVCPVSSIIVTHGIDVGRKY
jgi:hypothetical protein